MNINEKHTAIAVERSISHNSDVLNFIGSYKKIAPHHLVVFQVTMPNSDFLLIGVGTITSKEPMDKKEIVKASVFIE